MRRFWVVIAALLLVGCAHSVSPMITQAPPANQDTNSSPTDAAQQGLTNAAPTDLGQIETDTKAVVADYFAALVNQDFAKANDLTAGSFHVQDPADLGKYVEFQKVEITDSQFEGTRVQDGNVVAIVQVTFLATFASGKQGAWNDGENTRWAALVWTNTGWKLRGLGTSP